MDRSGGDTYNLQLFYFTIEIMVLKKDLKIILNNCFEKVINRFNNIDSKLTYFIHGSNRK